MRSMYVDLFTDGENLKVEVKMSFSPELGNYPVLNLTSESKGIRIYPDMEQLKQLNLELTKFIIANEPQEMKIQRVNTYLQFNNDIIGFTKGKEYLSLKSENNIHEIKDDDGELRYIDLNAWNPVKLLLK